MTIIRLITDNYLQTLCSLSSSCGETELNIALQNPLPSPRPPGSRFSPSPSRYIPVSPFSFFIQTLLFIPSVIHVVLFQSLPISSLRLSLFFVPLSSSFLGPPSPICEQWSLSSFSPLPHISLLNPNILFIYVQGHAALHLPPSSLSPERLTIPSASLLIYHPNGGYKREKTTICRRRNSHRRARKVSGLPLSINFWPVTWFYSHWHWVAQNQSSSERLKLSSAKVINSPLANI